MANISTIKVGSTSYGITPASHASTATTYGAATASKYGHVKLSDNYTSSAGAAASGIGASSLAVYNAYNTLNSNLYANLSIPRCIGHDGTRKIYELYFSVVLVDGFKSSIILNTSQYPVYAPLEITAVARVDSGNENNWCPVPLDGLCVFYGQTGQLTINLANMMFKDDLANARIHGKLVFASKNTI